MLGASYDPPAANRAFAEKYGFGFRLLSDEDHTVGVAYGAERDPGDERFGVPLRVSYLIDPQGVIARVYAVSEPAEHASEVVADLRALG